MNGHSYMIIAIGRSRPRKISHGEPLMCIPLIIIIVHPSSQDLLTRTKLQFLLKAQESQTYKKIKMVKIYAGITKLKMDVNVACANSVMCAQCVMKNIPHISTSLSKGNSKLSFLAHLPIKLINGNLN